MHWLIPAQTAAMAGTSLLASVFYYLHSRYQHHFLRIWAAAWTVYAFRFVAELIGILAGAPLAAAIAAQAVTLFSGILLLFGTYAYLSRPLPRAWLAAGGIGLSWMLAAAWLGGDFRVLTGPTSVVIAAAYAWTGRVTLRSSKMQGIGKKVAGCAFIAWSALTLGSLFREAGGSHEEWGLLVAAFLETSVAAGVLMAYFDHSRAELARKADHLRRIVENMPVIPEELIRSLRSSEMAARRLLQEKAAMAEIGRIVGSTLTTEDVYEPFIKEARKIVAFDRITITRILPERAAVQILYTFGPAVPERGRREEYPLSGTISEKIVAQREGIAFAPGNEEELIRSFPTIRPMWKAGFRSFLLVPLISRDQVIGALVLSSYAANSYSRDDVAIAANIASQISGAIANAQLFAEHQRMADALAKSEASLKSIFRVAPIGIGVVHQRILTQVNDRICEMLGYAAKELVGNSARMLYPTDEDFEFVGREKYMQIGAKGTGSVETRWRRKDGSTIDILLSSTPLDPADIARGVTFTALDITERKRAETERLGLEERLRQAQKMEAIGTLAGGIAHDFNNILAAVIGFGELAKLESDGRSEVTASIDEILKASFRARDLVRQILTFSRQAESEFSPIQPHLIVKEAVKLLRASLPSTIHVNQDMASQAMIMGDPTQIHQVVMNLCTNAYHAMRDTGGNLDVGLAETSVDKPIQPELKDLEPGRYLRLRVQDTGHGIDPGFIHRIFDPYFTTKEKAKGTGLGLAVVHGIVKSHRGAVAVSSILDAGTTFDVYFPIEAESAGKTAPGKEAAPVGGSERILFVDDEPAIQTLGKRLLGDLGYDVMTCSNAGDALDLFRSKPEMFDIVITDMTMPGMTGDRMALEMMRIRPELPVIVCTGFNELINRESARELGIQAFLMKPFLKNEVAPIIRELLDRKQSRAAN